MGGMETQNKTPLEQFRQALYQSFKYCADATMDLLDALASQTSARSVAELSLEPVFRREYSSLYAAIDGFFQPAEGEEAAQVRRRQETTLLHITANYLRPPMERPYWLFVTDVTSHPRRFARTLEDRGFVYQPNSLKGNKPVTIGHQYSVMAYLPERTSGEPPWVAPLVARRVTTKETETTVAMEHLQCVFDDESLPWHEQLSVQVLDTKYSPPEYLHTTAQYAHLVTIVRARSNRVFYRQYQYPPGKRSRGKRRSYGERFALKEPDTWHAPDEQFETSYTTKRGRTYTVKVQCWHNMLMRGKREHPMHNQPFTLVRVVQYDPHGRPAFKKPLWLIVFGKRRHELSPCDIWEAYRRRYDIEHFFRFGKQRLLLTAYQTPDVEHEESWWQLAQMAYLQLYLAQELVEVLPRPWERNSSQPKRGPASPAATQRGFGRVIRQIGTPAQPPKPRGNSPGRAEGTRMPPRERRRVVKKT